MWRQKHQMTTLKTTHGEWSPYLVQTNVIVRMGIIGGISVHRIGDERDTIFL